MEPLKKKHLFWDINIKELDPYKHKKFILERILNYGDVDDFKWALNQYGKQGLKEVNFKRLDKKSANFWQLYLKVNG